MTTSLDRTMTKPRRRWPRPLAGLLLAGAALAAGCASLEQRYVAADRATHDAIAPEYRRYVERDVALTSEQRARRLRTLEAWAARLGEAERDQDDREAAR